MPAPRRLQVSEGMKFGRWTVVGEVPSQSRKREALCRCECGSKKRVRIERLHAGLSSSCHRCCLEAVHAATVSHGRTNTPEYACWHGIKTRCLNPNAPNYANYGGRGITICDEWKNSFQAFLNHVGPRPHFGMSLDRIDNEKGYCPGNVRWATDVTQARNRRSSLVFDYLGRNRSLFELSEISGLEVSVLRDRITRRGWSVEDAIATPFRSHPGKGVAA